MNGDSCRRNVECPCVLQREIIENTASGPQKGSEVGNTMSVHVRLHTRRSIGRVSFFPYSHQPSMDEPPSPLLKSRIPRKTAIVDDI